MNRRQIGAGGRIPRRRGVQEMTITAARKRRRPAPSGSPEEQSTDGLDRRLGLERPVGDGERSRRLAPARGDGRALLAGAVLPIPAVSGGGDRADAHGPAVRREAHFRGLRRYRNDLHVARGCRRSHGATSFEASADASSLTSSFGNGRRSPKSMIFATTWMPRGGPPEAVMH